MKIDLSYRGTICATLGAAVLFAAVVILESAATSADAQSTRAGASPVQSPKPALRQSRLRPPISFDCDYPVPPNRLATREAIGGRPCAPPYQTPIYKKPPDDSIVFKSLLEASGYTKVFGASWVGVAAGNFCGSGSQLILAQNRSPNFSVMAGPAPYLASPQGTADLLSSGSNPWRALAAGKLDGGPNDDFVAIREVTSSGVPDLMVGKVNCGCLTNSAPCAALTITALATIGSSGNSDWVGAAVGNFDGSGKQIALLKTGQSNLFLVKLTQQPVPFASPVQVTYSGNLALDGAKSSQWKAMAAGDIDGDGLDELIVARQESDNNSPTILAYKWDANSKAFRVIATSGFGNNGNSNWLSATAGDFNADGRQAAVLVKDRHSNFTVIDLAPGSTELRILATDDLDSAPGQNWTGLAATDWMGGDQGASELIAVRAVHSPDRANVFVYGNPFHRIMRDSALSVSKAQWPNDESDPVKYSTADLKTWLRGTHTDTLLWKLLAPGDYPALVQFLHDTRNWGVQGRQLRVWLILVSPNEVQDPVKHPGNCSQPENTPGLTTWNALDFFQQDQNAMAACRDMLAWSRLAGRLAQDFPQLVGVGVDDFSDELGPPFPFTTDTIAAMESNMQTQAPWMNFAPFVYYPKNQNWTSNWGDLVLTLDSMVFFFRNQKDSICVGTAQCDSTVDNAPGEITDMSRLLPRNRKMLLGIYYWLLGCCQPAPPAYQPPTVPYDYNLTRLGLNMGAVGSTVAYGWQTPTQGVTCSALNFLQDRYCALQMAYSDFTNAATVLNVPSEVSFPQTAAGAVETEPLTVTNLGSTDVRVTFPPSSFKETFFWQGGTFVVPAGQARRFVVNFVARGIGLAQQTLTLTTDIPSILGGTTSYSILLAGKVVKGSPQ